MCIIVNGVAICIRKLTRSLQLLTLPFFSLFTNDCVNLSVSINITNKTCGIEQRKHEIRKRNTIKTTVVEEERVVRGMEKRSRVQG